MVVGIESSFAQKAFDSLCYFPDLGNSEDFDTIYGGKSYQHLGSGLSTLPPSNGEHYDKLVLAGLPQNIPFLTSVETGPQFKLHSLKIQKKFNLESLPGYTWGHFRSPKYLDLLYDGSSDGYGLGSNLKIYWADENGDFDTSRFTLVPPYQSKGGGSSEYFLNCYHSYLTSDTVEDMIISLVRYGIPHDSIYIALIKGGQQLYDNGRSAFWDEKYFWGFPDDSAHVIRLDSNYRIFCQGDFRGVGRADLIATSPSGNSFYYKNDPPFSLEKFAHAMLYDTLLAASEWKQYSQHYLGISSGMSIIAFPKTPADHSQDWLVQMPLDPTVDNEAFNGICLFKGGADFGSKRLSLNTPDYFLHAPSYYSPDFYRSLWPFIVNGGDLTGTGNTVLVTSGSAPGLGYGFLAFYVLGKALDDKIDLFLPFHYGGGSVDTITTNDQPYKSFIWGAPAYESPKDQDNDMHEKGSVRLLVGAKNIPVRLHASVTTQDEPTGVRVYPNPIKRSFTLTTNFDTNQSFDIILRDVLGRQVYTTTKNAGAGEQVFYIEIPSLMTATYFMEIIQPAKRSLLKVEIIE